MSTAFGRPNAPLLVVMTSIPSDGMFDWFWKVIQQECAIQKTDVRIVYLINGQPANSGGRPSVDQIKAAWPRFSQEMKESTPDVCIPMGGPALYHCTGITQTILDARGYLVDRSYFHNIALPEYEQVGVYKTSNKKIGRKAGDPKFGWVTKSTSGLLGADFKGIVIPTYGLDHIRKDAFACKPAFKEDVKRAARGILGTLRTLDDILEKNGYITEVDKLPRQWGDIIAIDIETHGMNNEVIDLVSFSDGETTAVLKWTHEAKEYVNWLFSRPDTIYAVHNSPFDIPRLRSNGVVISDDIINHRLFDTMFGAVVIQPDLHKSLARAITVYHDVKPWKGQRGSEWHEMSQGDPLGYSAKDAFTTVWLAKSEIAVMKQLGCWNLFMGQGDYPGPGVCATIPVLADMSIRGMRTNRPYAEMWCERLERRLRRYENLWARMFPGMNPMSPDQVQKLFYGEWGLPIQRNKKEVDSMTANELACVSLSYFVGSNYGRDMHPGPWTEDPRCTERTFELLLKLRDTSKTLNTYIQPVALGTETWVHPSYMPVSKDQEKGASGFSKGNTSTGRLASFGPNIQNQPKKVRALYLPDEADWCFVQADYKSAELYAMAHMAEDDRLLADLASGDMHQRNADRFNTNRDTAKNITYASQYLAGPAKVSEMILAQDHTYVPVDECKRIMKGLAEYYYKTTTYKQHLINMCDTKRYIMNPFGRTRFFHNGQAPAAVDFIPQSIVADVLWAVMLEVWNYVESLGGRMCCTVHDSILCQIHHSKRDEMALGMKRIMEKKFDCVSKGFFIPVGIEVAEAGEPWSEVCEYDPNTQRYLKGKRATRP